MKILFKLAILTAVGLFLSGCIEMRTLVTVKKDGSGFVEENISIGKEIIKMFTEFTAAFADSTQPQQEFNMFEEDKIKEKASDYGEGVEFVSMENIVTDEKEGYKAIYKFKDLSKFRVNQDPSNEMPMADQTESAEKKNEYVVFKFVKGNPNRITIVLPDESKADKKDDEQTETDETAETTETEVEADSSDTEQMIKFMKDMKAVFEIRVDGKITNTNATHVDGSKVTLFEIDFAQLVSDADKLAQFKNFKPDSFEEVKKLVSDIPGIKVELNKEVFIDFD